MTIVADSGSTKTTWAMVETGDKIVTEGLNPHFSSDETILAAYNHVRSHFTGHRSQITIHFYGAGCGNRQQADRMKALLQQGFGSDNVTVETDMLGACRAVCCNKAGLVGILGTGSNACYYDGARIVRQPMSTGYILGDFGSANHVGRILLNGYLTQNMPDELRNLFHEDYHYSDTWFMDSVYHQPNANRFLASLAPFAVKHKDNDYCRRVITLSLEDWLHGIVMPLCRQLPDDAALHVVGGYAKAIEGILKQFVESKGIVVGAVVADPMDGLIQFHSTL